MSTQAEKAKALAEKIEHKAREVLSDVELEMTLAKWRPEFRAIVWGAIADLAFKRKFEAEQQQRPREE